jgi:phage terminase small subunit
MPRGGARPGAGRPRKNPAPEGAVAAKKKPAAKKKAAFAGVAPKGAKPASADAWPFGTAPPAEPPKADPDQTPLDYLLEVMRDPGMDDRLRMEAAKTAAPYVHGKVAEVGKKAARADAAKTTAAVGRFRAGAAPKLVAAGGKKV